MIRHEYLLTFVLVLFFFISDGQEPLQRVRKNDAIEAEFNAVFKAQQKEYSGLTAAQTKVLREAFKERHEDEMSLLSNGLLMLDSPLQKVLDSLLNEIVTKNNLPGKYRIFLTGDLSPNAYNTGDGYIFFNIGLLERLHSIEEVAFVIAHELTHDLNDHPNRSMVDHAKWVTDKAYKTEVKDAQRSQYRKASKVYQAFASRLAKSRSLSRQMEYEADSIGMYFISNLGIKDLYALRLLYTLDSIDQEETQPLIDVKAEISKLIQPIDEEWFGDHQSSLGSTVYKPEEMPDSLRTHPEIKDRLAHLRDEGRYLKFSNIEVSPNYYTILQQARQECLYSWLDFGNYGASFFYSMRQIARGDSVYGPRAAALSLYLLAEARKKHETGVHLPQTSNSKTKQYNECLHMLHEFTQGDYLKLADAYLKMAKPLPSGTDSQYELAIAYLIQYLNGKQEEAIVLRKKYLDAYPYGIIADLIEIHQTK